ncbi:MAG TPA: universal stress protein [Solirubrobacterales bacterium]|nr:universal stress protein [Solirubrobacterales bacterium]
MSTIVVGYDSSDCGKQALDRAVELAKSLSDQVVVVFGYAPPGIWGGEIVEHEEAIEELGEKLTAEARERAAAQGIEVEVAMVPKRGAEALIEVADQREARMIVVGSYGEAPLKGALLGSTPNRLLHIADRPVLVVPASG